MARNNKIEIIISAVDKATKSLSGISNKFNNFSKSFSQKTKSLQNFTKVSVGMGAIIGGLATKEFMEFEQQMSKVKAITGANQEEFKKLTKIAKKMGATTAFTARESGDALEFLGMAGLSVKESIDALPGTLELAAAGNMSLGESADIATNIMAQYGIEAKNIGRVNDVLAKSATSANTSVSEMAEAMKYLGPVANTFGVSLEESAAAIDVLANNGIKASMAGQSFSASLLRITKPTDNMMDSIRALNLQLFDQNGQYIGITKTIKQLERGTKNMTDEQKAQHIATVFGIQSSKQRLTLLKEGSGTLKKYTKELENAEGTAKKMSKTMLNNLAGSFTLLKSAISGILISIGEKLAPMIKAVVDGLTNLLTNFSTIFEGLSPQMQSLVKTVGVVVAGFTGFITVVGAVGMALPLLSGALTAVGTVLGVLTGPIGLIVAGVVALGVAWSTNFMGIRDKTQEVRNYIKPILTEIRGQISSLFTNIQNTAIVVFDALKPILIPIRNIFKTEVSGSISVITEVLKFLFTTVGEVFKGILGVFNESISFVRNVFTGNRSGAFNNIVNIFTIWRKAIENIFGGMIESLSSIVSIIGSTISTIFTNVFDGIKNTAFSAVNYVIDQINKVISAVNSVSSKIGITIPKIQKLGQEARAVDALKSLGKTSGSKPIGGPVVAGQPYSVGELGREVFVPNTNGKIIPNNQLGGSPNININFSGGVHIKDENDMNTFADKVRQVMIQTYSNLSLGTY